LKNKILNDDDQHIHWKIKHVYTKNGEFTISMNTYKNRMINNFKKGKFNDRDRYDVSLMLHETVLNMTPNRSIGDWLLKDDGTIL